MLLSWAGSVGLGASGVVCVYGRAAGTGQNPHRPSRRGLRLPRPHHPPPAETRNAKHYVYTTPSNKAIQKVKDKVKTKTCRSTRHQDLDTLILSLNRSLRGWANYFRYGVSKAIFSAVDQHAWWRLMRWIRLKYQPGAPKGRRSAAKKIKKNPGLGRSRSFRNDSLV
jgi:hypothetical protein